MKLWGTSDCKHNWQEEQRDITHIYKAFHQLFTTEIDNYVPSYYETHILLRCKNCGMVESKTLKGNFPYPK